MGSCKSHHLLRRFKLDCLSEGSKWKQFGIIVLLFLSAKLTISNVKYISLGSDSKSCIWGGNKMNKSSSSLACLGVEERLRNSEKIYKKSVELRKSYFKTALGDSESPIYYWNYLPPSFNCPHSVQRLGRMGVGGKWVCGIELYETSKSQLCVIYSFGVENESSFEAEMLDKTNCEVYAYDFNAFQIGYPLNQGDYLDDSDTRLQFRPYALSPKNINSTFMTLGKLMKLNGHDWIDFLKLDIGGSVIPCLTQVMEEFNEVLPFGQVQIKFQVENYTKKGLLELYEWWERLEHHGLRPFASEVNQHQSCRINSKQLKSIEYSFININGNKIIASL